MVTPYARKKGSYTSDYNKTAEGRATGWWWLRSPGNYSIAAAHVFDVGAVDEDGLIVDDNTVSVRPALWLNL